MATDVISPEPRRPFIGSDGIERIGVLVITGGLIFYCLLLLDRMVVSGKLDPVAALGIIGTLIAGGCGYLWGQQQAKASRATFEAGVRTPGPGSTTVTSAGGDVSVQGGDPTVVEAPGKVKP